MKKLLTYIGTGLAALAVSACCWIPALLGAGAAGSLGIGAALAPYRPYLLGLTAIFITAGFTFVYRRRGEDCCSPDGCLTDAAQRKRWTSIGVMWAVALFALVMAAYPYVGQARVANDNVESKSALTATGTAAAKRLVFNVEGMDCAACAAPIKNHVEDVIGVDSATIDFEAATLVVVAKSDAPSDEAILAAVAAAGFTAKKKDVSTLDPI